MTRDDLVAEVLAQLQVAINSNRYPSTRILTLVQNAYRRATTLFIWKVLTRARVTSTTGLGAGDDETYYDYPEEFRTGSVYRVRIDEKEYTRKSYESFLDFRDNYPNNSNELIFANNERYIFISPDTVVGTSNMDIWGAIEAPALTSSSTKTIFSDNAEEGNNAVVRLAVSSAVKKTNPRFAQSEEAAALVTLQKLNTDEWAQYQRDQPIDSPLLDVPDYFGRFDNSNLVGRFVGFNPLGF